MPIIHHLLTVVAGAFLLATVLFGLMAVPGFLSDRDSTAPSAGSSGPEAGQ